MNNVASVIELKSSMARINSKLLLVGLCLFSAPLCFGQTKYRLANGHLDVASVIADLGSKNTLKSTLARKSVDFFGARAIPDIIDFLDKASESKIEVGSEIYAVLTNFGAAGKPYLIAAASKGSDLARMVSMRAISTCVRYEKTNYTASGTGDNVWVNDEDVKRLVLNGCKDEIPQVQTYAVTMCNWMGFKGHEALSYKLIENEDVDEFSRWNLVKSLLSQDAGNEKDVLEAAKPLLNTRFASINVEIGESAVNGTTRRFLLSLLKKDLYPSTDEMEEMKAAVLSRLCEYRDRADYDLARDSLQSDNFLIAEAAIQLIGASGGSEVVDYLKDLCKSDEYFVHGAALEALGYTDDEKIIPFLKQVIKDDEDFGSRAIAGLGHTRRYDLIEFLTPFMTCGDKSLELSAEIAIYELRARLHRK